MFGAGFAGNPRIKVKPGKKRQQTHAKQGVGGWGHPQHLARVLPNGGWYYTWESIEWFGVRDPWVWYPMVWNPARFESNGYPNRADFPAVFGYNEPELPSQANMTTTEAAAHWHNVVEPAFPNKPLIAPGPCFGPEWLVQMYSEYQTAYGHPPRFDGGLAVHCYMHTAAEAISKTQQFINQAQTWNIPNRKVWITEWSLCVPTEREQFAAWCDANEAVAGHAWFSAEWSCSADGCDTSLVTDWTHPDLSELTPAGEWFVGRQTA